MAQYKAPLAPRIAEPLAELALKAVTKSHDSAAKSKIAQGELTADISIAAAGASAVAVEDYNVAQSAGYACTDTYATVTDGTTAMSVTPAAGTYIVFAHAKMVVTSGDLISLAVAYDGTVIAETELAGAGALATNTMWAATCKVVADGAKAVTIVAKWGVSSGPNVPLSSLSLVKAVTTASAGATTATQSIEHKLGRKPIGYAVVSWDTWPSFSVTKADDKRLTIQSTATAASKFKLWVF